MGRYCMQYYALRYRDRMNGYGRVTVHGTRAKVAHLQRPSGCGFQEQVNSRTKPIRELRR